VLLDQEADLILDSGNVGDVCRARPTRDLVVLETLALIFAWGTEAL